MTGGGDQSTLTSQTDYGMGNERITENIVRKHFDQDPLVKASKITIEEQKSANPRIEKLLKNASKTGQGLGKPEFIVTFHDIPDLLLIVECKADEKKHESQKRDNPKDYAVDGVLLYSSYLSKEFDVISVAVSGQGSNPLVSTFLQLKSKDYIEQPDKKLISFQDYGDSLYKPEKVKKDVSELLRYSKKLHNQLRDNAKLIESEKPLFVSAVLMALTLDPSFVAGYKKEKKEEDLAISLVSTVTKILRNAKLPQKKIEAMTHVYDFIKDHSEFIREKDKDGKPSRLLYDLIKEIEENVMPFMASHEHDDVIGRFFGEFLRYTGGDKQGLGIVLTPKHITELFVDLAEVNKDSVVFDNCCGTAGFLISAMKKMIKDAGNDTVKKEDIKKHQLIGIETLSNMFALACANMILRGDGKANVYKKDCREMVDIIKSNHKCTVGFLNPPYSQKGEGLHELDFILNCLACLEKNSICIAIVPISCATSPSIQKVKLLEKHTLEAVMSMPTELFNRIGTVTCIMVFRAHVPHNSKKETWFGYWRYDGFVKTKHEGRVDKDNKWDKIKQGWLEHFFKRKEVTGESVLHSVTADDEWVAEAYMETDYSSINETQFIDVIKKYVVFKFNNNELFESETTDEVK